MLLLSVFDGCTCQESMMCANAKSLMGGHANFTLVQIIIIWDYYGQYFFYVLVIPWVVRLYVKIINEL